MAHKKQPTPKNMKRVLFMPRIKHSFLLSGKSGTKFIAAGEPDIIGGPTRP